ncbi:S24 family peptidase [Aggregatibacter actinomycetemcomitans]|uniref:S24 family peptidase n=1 Tax=Aggregatibacter actinomycetemcomitans TaxID=714 RepID=UPI00355BA050
MYSTCYMLVRLHRINMYCVVFKDDDQMLVDLRRKEIKGDKIYLVQNGSSVWVKRVKIRWDGVDLIFDNKEEYLPVHLSKDEAESLQVIGQLAHLGKNMI